MCIYIYRAPTEPSELTVHLSYAGPMAPTEGTAVGARPRILACC